MLDLLEVASEPARRRLVQLLGSGERTVTELDANFTVSRSAISQHLLLLIDAGLLHARKDGRSRYYSLDPAGITKLKALRDSFWNTELDLLVAEAAELASSNGPPHQPPGEKP
ncbi:ArsR/SmtB family transcription factor [Glutamicibacter arilaitensis]|uniref:ArsR/SmtB family transcription factor n=1 Tax=Glutamicibacter arilaitensis TaxID=256701 RepID=UPI003FD501F3